jgi:ABC-type multidrug transport system fused ATPase/permease subunit
MLSIVMVMVVMMVMMMMMMVMMMMIMMMMMMARMMAMVTAMAARIFFFIPFCASAFQLSAKGMGEGGCMRNLFDNCSVAPALSPAAAASGFSCSSCVLAGKRGENEYRRRLSDATDDAAMSSLHNEAMILFPPFLAMRPLIL